MEYWNVGAPVKLEQKYLAQEEILLHAIHQQFSKFDLSLC